MCMYYRYTGITSTFTFVSSESFKVHFTKLILTVWQSILTCTINTRIINELPTHVYTQAVQNVCSHSLYIRNTYSPQKLFTFNNSMCVHWTRNFGFTKPWHIKPPYITLCLIKKNYHWGYAIHKISVYIIFNFCYLMATGDRVWYCWWFNINDVPPVELYLREVFFLPWSWETCDRLMVICFTLQLSNCYLIHETEVLNFVWTIKFLSFHLFMEGEGELGVSS